MMTMTNKGKKYAVSEKRIETAWVKYRIARFEVLEKARAKGDYTAWQYEWIDNFEEFRLAYKQQRATNQAKARIKGKEYYANQSITGQLIKQAKIWKTPTIRKYAKGAGLTMNEAVNNLKSMTRQDLFDTYLQMFDGDYDAASAMYEAVVNGVGEATAEYATNKSEEMAKKRQAKELKKNNAII